MPDSIDSGGIEDFSKQLTGTFIEVRQAVGQAAIGPEEKAKFLDALAELQYDLLDPKRVKPADVMQLARQTGRNLNHFVVDATLTVAAMREDKDTFIRMVVGLQKIMRMPEGGFAEERWNLVHQKRNK